MSDAASSSSLSTDQIEERFLAALQVRPFPVADLLEMLVVLHSCGQAQRRDDCVLVLQEAFAEGRERDGLVRLLELRADWVGNLPAIGEEFKELLGRALAKDRLAEAQIDCVGLGTLPPREALRRLQVLFACKPGSACLDKTWGFGVVRSQDDFYRRVTVDFERRPGHAMAFAYAGEVLKPLDAQHILCIRHADRAAFATLVREKPGEAVKMALRSFGPMTVLRMEEEFRQHGLLPAGQEWKGFWSSARSALKHDTLVKVPPSTKKNEPLELLVKAVVLGNPAWFDELSRQRDVPVLLTQMASLEGKVDVAQLPETARNVLVERLQFAFRGAETSRDFAALTRTVVLAAAFGLDGLDLPTWVARVSRPEFVCAASAKLPARDIERLVALIPVGTDIAVALPFVDAIPEMPFALVDILVPLLLRGVAGEETRRAIREEFSAGAVPLPLLLWLARHQAEADIQALAEATVVATQCLATLDAQENGERLRLQHQIARRFEDFPWVEGMLARMGDVDRQALNERIHACEDAWEPAMKRSILGHMIKVYPELAERRVVSTRASDEPPKPRLTSWRSYNERVEQRRKLIEEDMPANSHDIAVARSYGDLRENFEYQSAKDTQRLLLLRQAELDAEIKSVKGTDFAGLATDRAGMGTSVTLQTASGSALRYHILGEWDSDEALGIVPCRSRVAESLEGHVAGDTVSVPTESGSIEVSVVAVEPLPGEILGWAMGRPQAS